MLILQRNKGEIINIGDDIEVQVTRINPYCVHIGITAPKSIEVWRNEVYRARKAGKMKSERIKERREHRDLELEFFPY